MSYLDNMHFLPEFDVKVLKDKCLLQSNPVNTSKSRLSKSPDKRREVEEEVKSHHESQISEGGSGNIGIDTMQVHLSEEMFASINWPTSFDFVQKKADPKDILGLVPVRSNLIWRYFLSLLKQRSQIKNHRAERIG